MCLKRIKKENKNDIIEMFSAILERFEKHLIDKVQESISYNPFYYNGKKVRHLNNEEVDAMLHCIHAKAVDESEPYFRQYLLKGKKCYFIVEE